MEGFTEKPNTTTCWLFVQVWREKEKEEKEEEEV